MFEDKVIGTTAGWKCRYTPTICDGPVYRWSFGRQEVSASRNGVMTHGGGQLMTPDSVLDGFLTVVGMASRISEILAKNDRETAYCERVIRGEVPG